MTEMREEETQSNLEVDILVLICTQSFTAEELVEDELLDRLEGWNVKARLVDEADIDWSDAGQEKVSLCSHSRVLLVVASTFADGDPPNHATEFADWLSRRSSSSNSGKVPPFAVFGLGDRTYQHFCAFGRFVDSALALHGGKRLLPFETGDAQADQSGDFRKWGDSVVGAISGMLERQTDVHSSARPSFLTSTGTEWRRSAVHGSVIVRLTGKEELLDHDSQDQEQQRSVLHVSFSLPSHLCPEDLQPGDHAGICPRNSPDVVARALEWLGIKADTCTTIMERSERNAWEEREISASELLTIHVDLAGRATASVLRSLLPFVGSLELRALARDLTCVDTDDTLDHPCLFDDWVAGRRLTNFDLAVLFECRPSLQAFARACGPMQPRLYSVVSVNRAPDATTTIGLCMAIAEGGLCSKYIASLNEGSELAVFFRRSRFRCVADELPVLLVAAGSGIGPCVGFLEEQVERLSARQAGQIPSSRPLSHTRLFFGCRKPSAALYKDRMSVYEGLGAHLHFAFSRIPGHRKDHVQDLVLKEAAAVWNEVFERSGRVYVCGRLELVDGVRNALRHVAMTSGGLDDEAAERAVQNLQDGGRLLTDCWSVDAPYLQSMNRGEPEHSPHVVLRLERHHAPAARPQHVAQPVDLTTVPAWPSYLRLLASGELGRRVERAMDMFSACVACGRYCETNRLSSDPEDWGECRVGTFSIVASAFPHFGEESCLVGTKGSGTIFFGACNLKCVYCQNWELSAMDEGEVFNDDRLAETMLMLQRKGCHNINFVSPTHNVAPILRAVLIAARKGLKLPLVWNTGGYDSVASLRLLEGVVDIFMPDAKYASRAVGRKLSKVDNYPEINQAAIKEMHRQVGELQIDRRTGLARRGVLVRHLVLPHDLAGTCCVASFLAKEISKDTFTNVMDQYRPEHKAKKDKKLGLARKPTRNELDHAHNEARSAGLRRFDGDEAESNSSNLEW